MAERRARRAYSEEQKKQLVELFNHGKPRSEIIREYDLTGSAFDKWVKRISNLFEIVLASVSAGRIRGGSCHTQPEPPLPGRSRPDDRSIHNSRCFAQCPDTGTALILSTCGHWP